MSRRDARANGPTAAPSLHSPGGPSALPDGPLAGDPPGLQQWIRSTPTEVLLQEGLTCLERFDRADLASQIAAAILGRDPANTLALGLSALVARRVGRLDDAEALLRQGLGFAPRDVHLHRLLAEVLLGRGRADEAAAQALVAESIDPMDVSTLVLLARLLRRLGLRDEALARLRLANTVDPDSVPAHEALATMALEGRRFDEALEHRRELARLAGQDPAEWLLFSGPFVTVRQYCLDHAAPYRIVEPAGAAVVHPPHYLPGPPPAPIPVVRPETYVAEIGDAIVVGGESFIVAPTGEIIWDNACRAEAKRFDLAERALWFARGGVGAGMVGRIDAEAGTTRAAILMTGVSSYNYFHWMVECLPRLAVLEALADPSFASLPLLVDRDCIAVPQLAEALRAIAGQDRELIQVESGRACRVERLVVPSQLAWLPNNHLDGVSPRTEDIHVGAEAIHFLRCRLGAAAGPGSGAPRGTRRVYLSKPGSGRLRNGEELEPIASSFGLEILRPERLTVAEQARRFADCDLIVSETGAGLTNLVFASPGTRVLVMTGLPLETAWFSQIGGVLGLRMAFLRGTVPSPRPKLYQSGFRIEPDQFRAGLSRILE